MCALGADHALEQINRSMKVSGGLVGINLNPNGTMFDLIAPELARLASEEAKEMAGTSTANGRHLSSYLDGLSALSRREER